MAWARFRNSVRYYRKVRDGKKVHSIYMGNGAAAEDAAKAVEDAAKERSALRDAKLKEKALDDQINALMSQGAALTADVLTAAGFHQYQRQWKLKTPRSQN
jgi:deoxyhypusine synthase